MSSCPPLSHNSAIFNSRNSATFPGYLSSYEKRKIETAVKLRNEITHFEFDISEEHAKAKFSDIFAFLVYFHGRYLKVEIEDILSQELLQAVIEIDKCFTELKSKAIQRIRDEDISPEWVWACPHCGEGTFVVEDDRNICFLCREPEEVSECPQCGDFLFTAEMEDFSDLIDTDYDEGQVRILNNYGYSKYQACPDCIGKVRNDIENQRAEDYYRMMEEEEWYRRRSKSSNY